jgi:predicted Zn-dependent protease
VSLEPAAELAERVVEAAGGEGCVAIVTEAHEADLRFANNTATTNGVRYERTVSVVRIDTRAGTVLAGSAQASGEIDVAALVAAAADDAMEADDAAALVDGDIDRSFGDGPAETDLSVLSGILASLAGAFARAESAGRILSGYAEHRVTTTYLATSTGLRRRHVQPTGALQLVGRSDDRSAWAGTGTASFADVSVEELEGRVLRGLDWARTRIDVPAGRHEVVLPPDANADLMTFLYESLGGRDAEEGRTVFSRPGGTRLGEALASLPFHLWSDPAEPGLECAPFLATGTSGSDVSVFDNGMALDRTDWVAGGRLEHLLYHRARAARSGVAAAGPVDNLSLALPGATGTVDDLVATTERGLLLTCLWYIRQVDAQTLLLTGLTRDGVYVVQDGKVVGAANNFRFNESPVDLLSRATEASASTRALGREFGEWMNRTAMPALRIPDFNMSSVSQGV